MLSTHATWRSAEKAAMSRLGLRPRTSSAVTSAEIGPAVKPIQGNMFMKNPGSPGTSPRIGFQSSVPLTMAGQTRSSRTEARAGTTC